MPKRNRLSLPSTIDFNGDNHAAHHTKAEIAAYIKEHSRRRRANKVAKLARRRNRGVYSGQ